MHIALIGRGEWGKKIERTLHSLGARVTAVPRGESYEAVDGAVIAVPSASHAALALPYILASVPTFIEKPLATSVADADALYAAAQHSGAPVFVGHLYLHHPSFHAMLQLVAEAGTIRRVFCEGKNAHPRDDSSVLWDWLPHHLSMAHALFGGSPDSVSATPLAAGENGMPHAARVLYSFGAGELVCEVAWNSPTKRMNMRVECDSGTFVFDDRAEKKLQVIGAATEFPSYDPEPPLAREMREFLRCVESRSENSHSLELGVSIVKEIRAAEESIAAGGAMIIR